MTTGGVERPPSAAAAAGDGRLGALTVLLLGSTLTVMAGAVLAPVLALIRDDLALTDTAAGLVLTVHGLALAVASPLVGRGIDRWGVRGPLAAGLVVYGAAGGAGAVIDGFPALIASRLVFGVGAAAVFTATTVGVFRLYRGHARDRAMGWRSSAISVGGLVWPLVGGALGGLSWHAPFVVYLLGVPLAAAVLLTLPAASRDARVGDLAPAHAADRSGVRPLLRARPDLLGFYALQGVLALLLYVMIVFVPLRLAEIGAGTPLVAAVGNCALSGTTALLGLAYARVRAGSGGDEALVRGALGTWVVAFAVAALVDHAIGLVAACAIFGLGMGVAVPALTVLVAERAPGPLLGRATSLSATATFAAQPFAPLLFGPLVGATSIPTGFLVAGATALVALALLQSRGRIRSRAVDGSA